MKVMSLFIQKSFFSIETITKLNYMKVNINPNIDKDDPQGYPSYPPTEDIYDKFQKAKNINPEEPSKVKNKVDFHKKRSSNEDAFSEDMSGDDLDVPGSELDDDQELNGEEDEENNYYSLGGDNHNDLEEDYNEYN